MNAARDKTDDCAQHALPNRPLTASDLDALPTEGGHRYELQDGALVVTPAPSTRHQLISAHLGAQLAALLPDDWDVVSRPGFAPEPGHYREPDLMVRRITATSAAHSGTDTHAHTHTHAGAQPGAHYAYADEILMMVEVVDPATVSTDRILKPIEYAGRGIPYYLLAEPNSSGRIVKLYLSENAVNPYRETDTDPERVFRQVGVTTTGGHPLVLPAPFTGSLDPTII